MSSSQHADQVRDTDALVNPASSIFFPVATVPAELGGEHIEDWVAIKRTDTDKVLSFQRKGYRVVANADVFPQFEAALFESGLDPRSAKVSDAVCHGGARTHRTYRFDTVKAEVKVGDSVAFELRVSNSYDGSTAFTARVGALRLICLNGMTIPRRGTGFARRHTAGFDADSVHDQLDRLIGIFHEGARRWERWAGIRCSDQAAGAVFDALPGITPRLKAQLEDTYWANEKAHGESTVWGLYNALTAWGTHGAIRRSSASNAYAIQLDRGQRVVHAVQSKAFLELEGQGYAKAA